MEKKYNYNIKRVAAKPRSKRLRDCMAVGSVAMAAVASTSYINASDKLDKATFDDLFRKVNVGTEAVPVWAIEAKYDLYALGDVTGIGRPLKLSNGNYITDRLDAWTDYENEAATWVLSAKLGHDLYLTQNSLLSRVAALEATPGLDTAALQQYLTDNSYAKLSDIPAVDLSPYLAKTEAAQLYQPKGNYLTAHQDLSAYAKKADAVTALGVSGNNLTWTKNGAVNSLTVPYAASSGQSGYLFTGGSVDPNTVETGTKLAFYSGISAATPNIPTFEGWQNALINIGLHGINRAAQLYVSSGSSLYFRSSKTSAWRTMLDSSNYAGVLDSRYYTKAEVNAKNYLLDANDGSIITFAYSKAGLDSADWFAAWNGRELRAISPTSLRTTIGAVTLTTDQEITGKKTFTNEVVATSKWITARIITGEYNSNNSTAQTKKAHSIELGYPNKDYMNFNEYGGVFNFYKTNLAFSSTGDGTLVAKISETGVTAASFVKTGGTASQFLMADGSVKTVHTLGAVADLGWGGTALQIPTISTLAFWNGAYSGGSSNLAYCNKGAFGDIVTHSHGEYLHAVGRHEGSWNLNEFTERCVKEIRANEQTTLNCPIVAYGVLVNLWDISNIAALQIIADSNGSMYFRAKQSGAGKIETPWRTVVDSTNYAGILDGRYYTESEADSRFVNAAGDTMTGMLKFSQDRHLIHAIYNSAGAYTNVLFTNRSDSSVIYGSPLWANVILETSNNCAYRQTSGTKHKIWDAGNDGPGSGLDADLLDGCHNGDVTAKALKNHGVIAAISGTSTFGEGLWLSRVYDNGYPCSYGNLLRIGGGGFGELLCGWDGSTACGSLFYRSKRDVDATEWSAWRRVAYVDDNVASATKLQTARSIWGQSFDGSGNVSGNMTGVGSISMNGDLVIDKSAPLIKLKGRENGSTIQFYASDNTYRASIQFQNNYGPLEIKTGSDDIYLAPGNAVRVKTSTASYALNAASFICDSWVRTKGATGWYNETYGGGWYMTDSTYIKNFNNKRLKIEGINDYYAIWLSSGGYCCEGYDGTSWGQGYGALNVGIKNNAQQTPLLVAYRVGAASHTGANRLLSVELLNSGTQLRVHFGGTMTHELWSNGNFHATGDVWGDGEMSGLGAPTSSDARLKNQLGGVVLPLDVIANAPAIMFRWKNKPDKPARVGTIAQYWMEHLPAAVGYRPDKFMTVYYGELAHIEAVSLSKIVVDIKEEVNDLRNRVSALDKENAGLKKLLANQ